ncbi:Conserved_hypothetical protein [Hexamita inflata]|uniref:Myb-like domain-containing protein n=1 Tax=Hexamita inflata TaxID=28002 RepID=A0AA86Q5T7_9EUKA|nr:Conserved hypothetical protein [Hexamita inflata]
MFNIIPQAPNQANASLLFSKQSKRTWTVNEKAQFKLLYKQYKKNFKLYIPYLDGRSEGQIKSFYQNVVHSNIQIQNSRLEQRTFNQVDFSELVIESTTTTFDDLDLLL